MILDDIVNKTKIRVDKIYDEKDTYSIKAEAEKIAENEEQKDKFKFEKALCNKKIAFICEVKKASPSKGVIVEDFDYVAIAKDYEKSGASAISVLTEPDFFMGDVKYLKEISENVDVPLLRKDFIVDEIQIYEAKLMGASAVLLICSVLEDDKLIKFRNIAEQLGLTALVEAHNEEEIERAVKCGARVIGVNNRNLKDFTVDINNSIRLRNLVDSSILFVSESGIKNADDIKELVDNKVNAVLIGETLMKSTDKKGMLEELKSKI